MPRRTTIMYCHDPACDGAHGVTVGIHPATWTEPADLDRDDCEHCGQLLHAEGLPACEECGTPTAPENLTQDSVSEECWCDACLDDAMRRGLEDAGIPLRAWPEHLRPKKEEAA